MKIAIIGAGSSYTPEIIEGLVQRRDLLPVVRITLMDINARRLEIMAGFCRRFLKRLGSSIEIETTTDRRAAIDGAEFILVQIRVGGNAQRVQDEKIPLKYGVIGQETTGPGGMLKAFRTIPAMLAIARDVEEISPQAWIVNYTNPTGLVAEAVSKYTRARIAGLCSGGLFPRWWASAALQVPAEQVQYDYVGLNHMNFAYNLSVHGRALSSEEFDRVAEWAGGAVDAPLIKMLRLLPSPYLQYYFHRTHKVKEALSKALTRGEEVQRLEEIVFRAYADESQDTKPDALKQRGGGGYSDVALGLMESIYNNLERTIIVNVPNQGAIKGFSPDAVFEMPCLVRADGIHPLNVPGLPAAVWGLVAAVKNYEQLAVEAAVTGSRETSLLALLAHPLVADIDTARPMLDELLEANRDFLPQFFPG
jgi:6-phospho-beta-glucosidase